MSVLLHNFQKTGLSFRRNLAVSIARTAILPDCYAMTAVVCGCLVQKFILFVCKNILKPLKKYFFRLFRSFQ
jgi:hypothetical protein